MLTRIMYLVPWVLLIICEARHGEPLFQTHNVWWWVFTIVPFALLLLFWLWLRFVVLRRDDHNA